MSAVVINMYEDMVIIVKQKQCARLEFTAAAVKTAAAAVVLGNYDGCSSGQPASDLYLTARSEAYLRAARVKGARLRSEACAATPAWTADACSTR